jgi:hypothetical protein
MLTLVAMMALTYCRPLVGAKERLMAATFDFPAFKHAFEAEDVEAWLAFFAPDAEWRE